MVDLFHSIYYFKLGYVLIGNKFKVGDYVR
jgi:hypothetical protein